MTYTQAQIDKANAVDLEKFLRAQGETLVRSGKEYPEADTQYRVAVPTSTPVTTASPLSLPLGATVSTLSSEEYQLAP